MMNCKNLKNVRNALIAAISFVSQSHLSASLNYETYLGSWSTKWQSDVQNLPPGPGGTTSTSYKGVTLNIGFACYSFASSPAPSGLEFASPSNLATVVNFVHNHGGKVRLSFGGGGNSGSCSPNYFISKTVGWPNNSATLASNVLTIISKNNLDGVDFDIEDPLPTGVSQAQFAAQIITFLKQVRSGLPAGKTMTLTIGGQGWDTYLYYLATGVAAVPGLVDYINMMEYDLWINNSPALTYAQQIQADLVTYTSPTNTSPAPNYAPGWGIPSKLIQVGLMPGCDDINNYLSLTAAQSIATFALTSGFYGVMTWDIDRDSGSVHDPVCKAYPANYQYSNAIRAIIGK